MYPAKPRPIGVFDSGYGGLTILREIRRRLPDYDYLYLGDNARAPYGTRSFDIVYEFTRQAVEELFSRGCHLVILACNTASAKALRTIQQHVLPITDPGLPRARCDPPYCRDTRQSFANKTYRTPCDTRTVMSHSYAMEIEKIYPGMCITEKACPMWVPLVETGEADGPGEPTTLSKNMWMNAWLPTRT